MRCAEPRELFFSVRLQIEGLWHVESWPSRSRPANTTQNGRLRKASVNWPPSRGPRTPEYCEGTFENVVNRSELPQDHVHCRVAERHGLVAQRQRAPIHDHGLVAARHGLKAERRVDKCARLLAGAAAGLDAASPVVVLGRALGHARQPMARGWSRPHVGGFLRLRHRYCVDAALLLLRIPERHERGEYDSRCCDRLPDHSTHRLRI